MSLVEKDLNVLGKYFEEQRNIGAQVARKQRKPIIAVLTLLLLLESAIIIAETKKHSAPAFKEVITLPQQYDFISPLPELINPLELPPTFSGWEIAE